MTISSAQGQLIILTIIIYLSIIITMKNIMKRQSAFYCLIFAVVLVTVVFSYSNLATAEEVELVYPNSGYLQAENVDTMGVNGSLVVTADNENHLISYQGTAVGVADFGSFDDIALKIVVFGQKAVIKGEKAFYSLDTTSNTIETLDATIFNNDCYLASDGENLYVHQYGKVSVFGSNLTVANATYEDSIFNNKPVLIVSGNTIFGFVVEHGVSRVYTYDTESKIASSFIKDTVVKVAFSGSTIYGYNGENIILIDKAKISEDDGTLDFALTDLTADNFVAYGDYLYIAKSSEGYDKYAYANGVLTLVESFSYTGSGLDRLNCPTGAIKLGNELVVADTLNNRLLYVGKQIVALDLNAPTQITEGNGRLYVVTADGIAIIDNKAVISTIKTNEKIVDLIYDDGLYVLTENGVYLYIIGTLNSCFEIDNAVALYRESLFYVLTESGVKVVSTVGDTFTTNGLLSFDIDGYTPLDIVADIVGNVYILGDDNAVHCYDFQDVIKANIDGILVNSTDIALESAEYNFTAKSMVEIDDKIVIATEENALFSIDNPLVKTKENAPKVDTTNAVVSTQVTTEKSYFMADYFDGKTAVKVDSGVSFVCYEIDGLLFTSYGGVKGWLYNTEKSIISTDCAGDYVAKTSIKLYDNPTTGGHIVVSEGTALSVIDNAGGYGDGKWVRVEYAGKIYYTEMSGLEKKTSTTPNIPNTEKPEKPEKVNKDYGRAKASRAGELVKLYSTEDNTVVVAQVTDGTRLEVVEKMGDYYKVKYNDTEVLIHKDHFKLDGLTTVQIIAIVLSVIVVLAGGLIFMVTSLSRKKEEKE